jgi:hypothetical protein
LASDIRESGVGEGSESTLSCCHHDHSARLILDCHHGGCYSRSSQPLAMSAHAIQLVPSVTSCLGRPF